MTSSHLRSDRRGMWTAARTHTPCGGSRPDVGTGSPGRGLWTALRAPLPGGGSVPHRGTRQRRVRVRRVQVRRVQVRRVQVRRVQVPRALGRRTRRRRVGFFAAAIGRPGRRGWRVVGAVAVLAGCLSLVGCQGVAGGPRDGEAAPTRAAVGRVGEGRPVSLAIAAAGVDARVVPVGSRADRTMEVPAADLAGWYEPGPRPGEAGPAVIVGHVDSRRGPAVFFRLGRASTRRPDRGRAAGWRSPVVPGRAGRAPAQDGPPDPAHLESHPPAGAAPDHLWGRLRPFHRALPRQRHRLCQGR